MTAPISPYLQMLKNRIDLKEIPFSERGSRMLLFRVDQSLSIRLAERWFKQSGQLAAYRDRPAIISQLRFTDGGGNGLEFETTTYPHLVECRTAVGMFSLAFVDPETLLVALPPGPCGLTFLASVDQVQADRRGGVLRMTGEIRRNIAFTTNAAIRSRVADSLSPKIQKVSLLLEGAAGSALLLNITPRLGFNRHVPDPTAAIAAAAARWHTWFAAAPPVADEYRTQYYYAWWVMRAGLISPRYYTTREAMTPSKIRYVGVWQWDAYFHALAYRHIDSGLAQDQLRIVLDHQRQDGMIPDAVHDEGTVSHLTFPVEADVTKPPLVAWTAWKLFEHQPDREFLQEIYEALVRCNAWWFDKNDLDHNGLCEYQHPYSSGLDDSPLWDEGVPVESPDLNTYLFLEQEALSRIAGVNGEEREAAAWSERAESLVRRMIDQTWDEGAGLFWARRNGKRVDVRTPFNLYPLITGRLPSDIAARLISHLTDRREYWPPYPVPSVALDDPKYNPDQMWRGPTWVNVNYLLIEGLERSGFLDLACELRRRTLNMIARQGDIYEYYHPETGGRSPEAASIFGWSSAIFIDLAIRETREQSQPKANRADDFRSDRSEGPRS
jgi:hypothetical protein